MSIDLNWETLTGGPDGAVLAEHIRDFIHTKFQSVPLPRFIKSVTVHDFQFGSIPPRVVLKDICDPLPDFYEGEFDEDDEADEADDDDDGELDEATSTEVHASRTSAEEYVPDAIRAAERRRKADLSRRLDVGGTRGNGHGNGSRPSTPVEGHYGHIPPFIHTTGLRSAPGTPDLGTPFLGLSTPTPGIPGGTSNMHYFQSKLASGWSGTQTPLAAVAGAQHLNGWLDASGLQSSSSSPPPSRYSHSPGPGPGHNRRLPPPPRPPSLGSISAADFPSSSLTPPTLPVPLREKHSVSTLAPTSAGASRPPTRDRTSNTLGGSERGGGVRDNTRRGEEEEEEEEEDDDDDDKYHERRVDDMQAVFRIRYGGDVKLMLTAEILLDYPMPSFVGIPVKLNITGLTFDGVGVVANIRKRVHFCFLSPEDALAAVGDDDDDDDDDEEEEEGYYAEERGGGGQGDGGGYFGSDGNREAARGRQRHRRPQAGGGGGGGGVGAGAGAGAAGGKPPRNKPRGRMGGLLQEIRVESEIGQREGAKQSLKNVGKVEKFVLEQVRRIFEEEFVYPSFWTFLV